MANLPDIILVNHFCLRLLSTLAITSCKGIVLVIIVFFMINRYTSLSSGSKHLVLFSVFAFFMLSPLFIWISQLFTLEVIQIARKNGETYDSVRSVLLINTKGFSNTILQNQSSYTTSYQSVYSFSSRLQWPFWVIMVWALGILISLSPVLYGLVSIMRLKKTAIIRESTSLTVLLKELTREVGMSKSIPVFISKKCQTPFASGIFFTKILGPEDFEGWPKEQLRVVLLHELAHIKRQDLFTQCISRLICSIFWFLPFLWLCYSHLRIEQEKSCDVMTIGTGLNPADFATHLIGLVRHMKAHAYASAVFIFNGRKKMIEKRVVNALQLKCWTHQNKKAIRYVLSIFLICLAGLLIINPVSAEDVAGSLDQKEMLCGTWINTDYNTRAEAAKIILNPDGSYYFFAKISSKTRLWGVSYLIEDAWTDADQNTWYKMRTSGNRYKYSLYRINDTKDCLEFVYHTHKSDEYPTSIPEDHPNYRIYYKLQ